ncbi:MAG TPA: hypothetical protein VLD19_08325, partial [Chitinophagaceae bacterium]|nr:hypothetical protein [Chitinophagaceae bacterium]
RKVASFDSYRFGMGKFAFTPQKGQLYKATITTPSHIDQVFELPVAANEGVVMNTDRQNDMITVQLFSTGEREITLAGQTKNTVYYTTNLRLQKGENRIEIPEKLFPAGIATLTAITADGWPLAERLVFLHERGNLQVSITPDKQKYLPREKVTLAIQTTDAGGQPIPSNLSIAVVDDKLWSFADDKQDHILSWLLMSSELKGKIEEPSFYFKKDEPMAVPALDLVMLTHGYRYFDYIPSVEKEGRLAFSPDQEDMLSGVIVDSRDKPVKATIYLVSAATGQKAIRVNTGEDGLFFFSELAPNSNYYLLAKAIHKKDKISIRLLQNGIGYNPLRSKELRLLPSKNGEPLLPAAGLVAHRDELKKAFGKMAMADLGKKEMAGKDFLKLGGINHLDEVVVIGYGTARRMDLTGAVATINAMQLAPANNVVQALQGRAAGLEVIGNANPLEAPKMMIRGMKGINGNGQPLYVLNGV